MCQVLAADEVDDELWSYKQSKSLPVYFYGEGSTYSFDRLSLQRQPCSARRIRQWIKVDDIQDYTSNKEKHNQPKKQQKTIMKAMKEIEDESFEFVSPKERMAQRKAAMKEDEEEEEEDEEEDEEESRPKKSKKRSADDGESNGAPKRKKASAAKKEEEEKKEKTRIYSL